MLTFDQAIEKLRSNPAAFNTTDALRSLANEVSIAADGKITVLYSGPVVDGASSSEIVKSMLENGADIRVIDKTDAAKLMESREFLAAWADAYGLTPEDMFDPNFDSDEEISH